MASTTSVFPNVPHNLKLFYGRRADHCNDENHLSKLLYAARRITLILAQGSGTVTMNQSLWNLTGNAREILAITQSNHCSSTVNFCSSLSVIRQEYAESEVTL